MTFDSFSTNIKIECELLKWTKYRRHFWKFVILFYIIVFTLNVYEQLFLTIYRWKIHNYHPKIFRILIAFGIFKSDLLLLESFPKEMYVKKGKFETCCKSLKNQKSVKLNVQIKIKKSAALGLNHYNLKNIEKTNNWTSGRLTLKKIIENAQKKLYWIYCPCIEYSIEFFIEQL